MVWGEGGGREEEKIPSAAACRSDTAPRDWTQTFIVSMFAIFAVAATASAPLPHGMCGLTAVQIGIGAGEVISTTITASVCREGFIESST